MSQNTLPSLVSTTWMAEHLTDPDLRILDGSWYLPDMNRDAAAEFARRHIPNARRFDIDDISDHRSDLPHMMPPVEKFLSRVRALGVGDGHKIVVYDGAGIFSAARVWWTFRVMGHPNVAVLDGGLPKWMAEGHPVEVTAPLIRDRHMTPKPQPHLMKIVTEVAAAAKLGDHAIVDARSAGRFRGDDPEPRAGLRAGHIPNARNLPFKHLFKDDGTMHGPDRLRTLFEDAGVDLAKPVITTCGSGVSAAILNLALEQIGHDNHSLYDGSWAEWGMYNDLKIATGDA